MEIVGEADRMGDRPEVAGVQEATSERVLPSAGSPSFRMHFPCNLFYFALLCFPIHCIHITIRSRPCIKCLSRVLTSLAYASVETYYDSGSKKPINT